MKLTLKRLSTGSQGTFGCLLYNDLPFVVTLEREWDNNRPSVGNVAGACILAGEYTCKRVDSPRFKDTFEITDVEGRTHILFHWGNLDDNSRGCVLVGEEFGKLGTDTAILSSKKGFREFMKLLSDVDEFELEIIDCF